jgi:EmrB/QacA subfamily drug resistance transporter
MLAPILGPTIGGLILQNMSWRWIFYVNVPIGVIGVIAALRVLPTVKPGPVARLDTRGLLLMATGLPLLTYGLAEVGVTGGFSSPKVIVPFVSGIALVATFVLHALKVPNPLLDVRLYRRPTFASASFAMFCLGAALFGGMILLPLYWQDVRAETVIVTGLLTAPQGLGAAFAMPIAGKLTDRMGGGPLALFGVTLCTVATIPFALIGPHTSIFYLSVAMFIRGIGIGFGFMPAMAAAFASLKRSELPSATPQLNVLQRVGGSIGTAVLAVVLQRALASAHGPIATAHAYGTAFWASAALSALAIIPCVILLRAERAARVANGVEAEASAESLTEAIAA